MYIKYINSEENPADILIMNCPKDKNIKHTNSITVGEFCYIMETGRRNVKNDGVAGVTDYELTEYSSHALFNTVGHKKWE